MQKSAAFLMLECANWNNSGNQMSSLSSPLAAFPARLVIASRESALAMWQAEHIRDRLSALYPHTEVSILGMTTQGDQILDVTLSKIGGKGLFVKELETALEEGRADLAVHSLKDVPMHMPSGFTLAAIGEREDPHDAFVSNLHENLAALPVGSIVGTSSLRRESQLRARFPHLSVQPLRGNVQTRLRKLDEGQYAAIILAAAGLKRLGLGARIRNIISSEDSLPAVGQGALGIECRIERSDVIRLLQPLHHPETAACVFAERAMSRVLAGSCQVPLGGFAQMHEGLLRMRGFVASPDGQRIVRAEMTGELNDPEALGKRIADDLLAQGAGDILAALNA
jgi:hydroxymethylbilane synthase